ncbi:MAG: ATP-binding cassette domain-containing protein, partial [Bhargavaea sp.]
MDIALEQVDYTYAAGTPFQKQALHDVNVRIPSGSYTAIIGHTGSGKSTLLQHLNGLLKPTAGIVRIGDTQVTKETKGKQLKPIRRKVGIVFQFPEHQLFEENVLKDVMFGPLNFG